MSLSPENYRGLEVECRELIANTQLLLSGKDSQQHQQAAVFIEDDMSLSNALSEKYQECIIGGKNAQTPAIRKKYLALADELDTKRQQLLARYTPY